MADCTQAGLDAYRAEMGDGHALTYAIYRRNVEAWAQPDRSGGIFWVLSNAQRQWKYVGAGGSLWVVVGKVGSDGVKRFSLTYRLIGCSPRIATGPAADAFGRCATIGDGRSQWFPANNAADMLMALRFRSKKAIPTRSHIAERLQGTRPLGDEDVAMLERYTTGLARTWSVFISYARAEGVEYAVSLKDALEAADISVFRDEEAIMAGDRWNPAVKRGVRCARVVVVLCSDAAWTSQWVQTEIRLATLRRLARSPARLVFVLLPGADPGPWRARFGELQMLTWGSPTEGDFFDMLLKAVAAS